MDESNLSKRQLQIKEAISSFWEENELPPTVRDIQGICNISSTSVVDYNLKILQKKGIVTRRKDVARGIELVGSNGRVFKGSANKVPVLGKIAAGSPLPVFGDNLAGLDEFITIESNMTRKWAIPVDDQSNMTTSTAFDFEGDGKTEVVYRDENNLYIIDGATGAIITQIPCGSGTRTELPVVVDVNGDGDAELVCTCSDTPGAGKGKVRVYESDSTIWVPTRKVWNTHNYVPTFINDDLTVPKEFQNKINTGLKKNSFGIHIHCPEASTPTSL